MGVVLQDVPFPCVSLFKVQVDDLISSMAKLVTRMRWLQHEKNIGELHQNNLARNVMAKNSLEKKKPQG